MLLRECYLKRGRVRTVGWIDARAARKGTKVTLGDSRSVWIIESVTSKVVPRQVLLPRKRQR
jgi:hypothetical protein